MKLVSACCPNCGAKIEVDENSDKTVCEYCGSKIVVEDAIQKYKVEISGEIEVKNMPKLENYLKLGERHYSNEEYDEAYDAYSKALELDADCYIAVLRKGLCKALKTNYRNFEVDAAINAMEDTYEILSKSNEDKKNEINASIEDCKNVVIKLEKLAVSFAEMNNLDADDIKDHLAKLKKCLSSIDYLYGIVKDDDKLKVRMLIDTINIINDILKLQNKKYLTGEIAKNGKPVKVGFNLGKQYRNELTARKEKCLTEMQALNPEIARKFEEKLEKDKARKSRNLKILCYVMVVISAIMAIDCIAYGLALATIMWILTAIIFVPAIKNLAVKKNKNSGSIIITLRVILFIIACMAIEIP